MIHKGNSNKKKAKTTSDKTDMEMKTIIRNKDSHLITIKVTTC